MYILGTGILFANPLDRVFGLATLIESRLLGDEPKPKNKHTVCLYSYSSGLSMVPVYFEVYALANNTGTIYSGNQPTLLRTLLRGTIVNRAYGIHKNLYI